MKKITFLILFTLLGSNVAKSQMITNDPIHTAITSLIKMFQDPSFKSIVSNIDKLGKVSSAVRQFHRGTEIINSVNRITKTLSTYSSAISMDGHIYPAEYKLMSEDIKKFGEEANKLIKDMKTSTTQSGSVLKMTDAERAEWLNSTHDKVAKFESMISRYFGNIRTASLRRALSKEDLVATTKLYETAFKVSTTDFTSGGIGVNVATNGYDAKYNENTTIPLDYLYETDAYKTYQAKMRECEFKNQMFYKRQEIARKNMEIVAFNELMASGWTMQAKKSFLQTQNRANLLLTQDIQAGSEDIDNIKANGSNSANLQMDMTQVIENEILAIYEPSGKRVDMEIFKMQIEYRASQLYLENGIDRKIEDELKLQDCKDLSKDFDKVMKEAEDEYRKANGLN